MKILVADIETKLCARCGLLLPAGDYYQCPSMRDGLSGYCRVCTLAAAAAYNRANKAKIATRMVEYNRVNRERNSARNRARRLADPNIKQRERRENLGRYKLTPHAFAALLEVQGGRCAICEKVPSYTPHVDHDHNYCPTSRTCGKCVRGILCSRCNTALAWHEEHAAGAAAYLERYANATA